MLKIYTDAATAGKNGPSGGGVLLIKDGVPTQLSFSLPEKNNHQAELAAIIRALEIVLEKDWQTDNVLVYSDSQTAIQTLDRSERKNPAFRLYVDRFEELVSDFNLLILQWIPEKENKGADHLARQGLQKAKLQNR